MYDRKGTPTKEIEICAIKLKYLNKNFYSAFSFISKKKMDKMFTCNYALVKWVLLEE